MKFAYRMRGQAWRLLQALVIAMALLKSDTAGAEASGNSGTLERTTCVHGVASGALNARAGPGLDKEVVARFSRNDCGLRLVGRCEGDWCEMSGPRARGWVDTRYVGIYEIPKTAAEAKQPRRKQIPKRVVRKGPETFQRASLVTHYEPRRTYAVLPGFGLLRAMTSIVFGGVGPEGIYSTGTCVVGVASWDTLRLRSGPGAFHGEIGGIPSGGCHVLASGPCRGSWCRVAWRGKEGWVNSTYLR